MRSAQQVRRRHHMQAIHAADLRRMGKRQDSRRTFRNLSTVGFASCVHGAWELFLTANGPGLRNGGLGGLFWSLLWTYIGQTFVVLSLAEMASMAPTTAYAPRDPSSLLRARRGLRRMHRAR